MRRISSVHPANSTINLIANVPASHSNVSDQKDSSVTLVFTGHNNIFKTKICEKQEVQPCFWLCKEDGKESMKIVKKTPNTQKPCFLEGKLNLFKTSVKYK